MHLSIYKLKIKDCSNFIKYIKDEKKEKVKKINLDENNLRNLEEGVFVYEESYNKQTWIEEINKVLGEDSIEVSKNKKYKGILVIGINSDYLALSFSGGIFLLKDKYIDHDFGYDAIKYFIDDENLSSYSLMELGDNLINRYGTSPQRIPLYEISNIEKLTVMKSISGYNEYTGSLSGKYNLSLRFDNKDIKNNLVELLKYILNVYNHGKHKIKLPESLELISDKHLKRSLNLKLVKYIQNLINKYETKQYLKESEIKEIGLHYEHDIGLTHQNIESYTFTGINRTNKAHSKIDKKYYLENLCKIIIEKNRRDDEKYILNKLKRDTIKVRFESGDSVEENIYRSIYKEMELKHDAEAEYQKAVLIQGNWYYLNKYFYKNMLDRVVKNIEYSQEHLKKFDIINVEGKKSENEYNEELANSIEGLVLDKKLYRFNKTLKKYKTFNQYSSVEVCDVFKFDSDSEKLYLFHIKYNDSAQGISHLVNQAKISTNLLLDKEVSEDYIDFIIDMIKENNKDNKKINIPSKEHFKRENIFIVLGVIDTRADKSLSNYLTINKLNALDSTILSLQNNGINVMIYPILKKE